MSAYFTGLLLSLAQCFFSWTYGDWTCLNILCFSAGGKFLWLSCAAMFSVCNGIYLFGLFSDLHYGAFILPVFVHY